MHLNFYVQTNIYEPTKAKMIYNLE
jgi:hypothetical protein